METFAHQGGPQFVRDQLPALSRSKGIYLKQEGIQRLRQILEAVLAEEVAPFPSAHTIAQRLGHSEETLLRHCPDLYNAIKTRYRKYWTEETALLVRRELENALKSPEPVPLSTVVKRIKLDEGMVRKHFPDLCQSIVSRYRERFDRERIQRRLKEVLASDDETPSLMELARQLGCKSSFFQRNYPEDCKLIIAKRLGEMRRRNEERKRDQLEEMRQVMLALHQKNIYPAITSVKARLRDPNLLRRPVWRKERQVILEELGY